MCKILDRPFLPLTDINGYKFDASELNNTISYFRDLPYDQFIQFFLFSGNRRVTTCLVKFLLCKIVPGSLAKCLGLISRNWGHSLISGVININKRCQSKNGKEMRWSENGKV